MSEKYNSRVTTPRADEICDAGAVLYQCSIHEPTGSCSCWTVFCEFVITRAGNEMKLK